MAEMSSVIQVTKSISNYSVTYLFLIANPKALVRKKWDLLPFMLHMAGVSF